MKTSELVAVLQQTAKNVGGDPDVVVVIYDANMMPVAIKEVRYWPINQGYMLIMGNKARSLTGSV